MVRWLIEIEERNVADRPPTKAGGSFTYDAAVNCGTLVDGIFRVSIYGQDIEAVLRGLFSYSALRAAPTSGDYDFQEVKRTAWQLLQQHLSGAMYIPKET
jgi:hypothetical protein